MVHYISLIRLSLEILDFILFMLHKLGKCNILVQDKSLPLLSCNAKLCVLFFISIKNAKERKNKQKQNKRFFSNVY